MGHTHTLSLEVLISSWISSPFPSVLAAQKQRACLVPPRPKKQTQKVLQYLSHQILRHMYGVLNVDERKN
jgi:hypothetical protein